MGRVLIVTGICFLAVGLIVVGLERLGAGGWRVPGDMQWGGRNWRVSVPFGSSILISLILTVVLNGVLWLLNRR